MATKASFFSLPFLHKTDKPHTPTFLPCPNFTHPKLTPKFPRLGVSYKSSLKKVSHVVFSCLVDDKSKALQLPEGYSGSIESIPMQGATIDLKLPRRSLLVHFTCNACGERSQKLISRLAYEKGTVFVECTGCLKYHNLVDNLNLVVEYNYREETIDADEA